MGKRLADWFEVFKPPIRMADLCGKVLLLLISWGLVGWFELRRWSSRASRLDKLLTEETLRELRACSSSFRLCWAWAWGAGFLGGDGFGDIDGRWS